MMARIGWVLGVAAAISFIAGYAISVIAGVWWPDGDGVIAALAIMGILVGLFNVTAREIVPYLVAAIALVLIGNTPVLVDGLREVNGDLADNVDGIITYMAIFTAPAAAVQAIRAGIALAKPG